MNTSLTNTTSSCPSFLADNPNVTVAHCGLPLCANTTAVMAECCAGSQVFPYHSVGGPDFHGVENFTDLNALWCQVDNSSAPAWLECISGVSSVGYCSAPSPEKKGWASRSGTVRVKTMVGLAVMVAVFHCML